MPIAILGDVHLGKSLAFGKPGIGSALNSRLIDQLNLLKWALNQCIASSVSDLVLTGDVFEDPKPHPTIITLFIEWLKECSESGVKVHIITGNHDVLRSGQFLISALDIVQAAEIENIFIYKDNYSLILPDLSLTFLPFRDRRSFNTDSNSDALQFLKSQIDYQYAALDNRKPTVLIGHLTIEGSLYVGDEIDDLSNELFCPLNFFSKFDFTWMGHIHKPQILNKFPHIAHIGSMDLSDFGEANHNKIMVLFDPNKNDPIKYIEIPTRPLKQLSIKVPDNIVDTTKFVIDEIDKSNLNGSIVKCGVVLENPDAPSIDKSIVEAKINEKGAFNIFRISEERKISLIRSTSPFEDQIDNTVDEITAIKRYANLNIEEDYKNDFINLASLIVNEVISDK